MRRNSIFVFAFYIAILCMPQYTEAQTSPVSTGYREEGIASWYGEEFDGRPTASGEIYNSTKFTAAHPTLPFGTFLIVTNKNENRQVAVKVNDRGPFVAGRIIDLSKAAAEHLNMINAGTVPVIIETMPNSYAQPLTAPAVPAPVAPVSTPPPNPQPAPQPVAAVAPAPVPEPVSAPKPAPTPEPVSAPKPAPAAEPAHASEPAASPYPPITVNVYSSPPAPPPPPPPQYQEPPQVEFIFPPQILPPPEEYLPPQPYAYGQPQHQPQPYAQVQPPPEYAQPQYAQPPVQPQYVPPPVQPQYAQPQAQPQYVPPPVQPQYAQPQAQPQYVPPPVQPQYVPPPVQPQYVQPQLPPLGSSPTPAFKLIPAINPLPNSTYKIQVGSYKIPRHAVDTFDKLKGVGLNPAYEPNGEFYRVVLAGIPGTEVQSVADKLARAGFSEALIREER